MSATAQESLLERLAARALETRAAAWDAAQRGALGPAAPARVAVPRDREELRELVVEAGVADAALLPVGGGSALAAGLPPRRGDLALSLERVARTIDHSPEDFVVAVEAGASFARVQEELAHHGQWIAVEPPDAARATLGGMIAAAATSLVAAGHGTLRHHLLGMRVLHADGRFSKSGGRVVKNVAGYDLMKLHHGALGTLGLVVEATLRLRPLPACDLLLHAPCDDAAHVVATADALAAPGLQPAGAHFHGHLRAGGLQGELSARFQGARAAAFEQASALAARTPQAEWSRTLVERGAPRPRPLATLAEACSFGGDATLSLLSLHAPPGRIAPLLAALARFGAGRLALDLVRGVGWLRLSSDGEGGALTASIGHGLAALGRELAGIEAALFLLGGPPELRALLPDRAEAPGAAKIAAQLRAELDPRGRFNPGRRGP